MASNLAASSARRGSCAPLTYVSGMAPNYYRNLIFSSTENSINNIVRQFNVHNYITNDRLNEIAKAKPVVID